MAGSYSTRFPPVSHIEELVGIQSPAAFTVTGAPEAQIRVLPDDNQLEARVLGDLSNLDVAGYRFLKSRRVRSDHREWNSITITWSHSPVEAYVFLCNVIERVQEKGESLATAVAVVLQSIGSILRRQSSLTREQEVGLYGELLVLNFLLDELAGPAALRAWKGPESEEHDFALGSMDLEVKTTTSEQRLHWITSEHQLQPIDGRPLKLVSLQITPKSGTRSRSLPNLVAHMSDRLGHSAFEFERILEGFGFITPDAELYTTEWALRDTAQCYAVDANFPKITGAELAKLSDDSYRINAVKYRIELSGLQQDLDLDLSNLVVPEV